MTLHFETLDDTKKLAEAFARQLKDKTMTITLDGDLGAGKTAWTRFFGQALGVKRTINSPTFTIMKSYKTAEGRPLYHMDAYRLEGAHQDLGFEECFTDGLCVVEWAEYIEEQIPSDHIAMSLTETGETSRNVQIEATGEESRKIVDEIMKEYA